MKTLVDVLKRATGSTTGVTFIDRRGEPQHFDYSAIAARAYCAAWVLAAHGVQPGERVGIILPTCIGFYDAFFGCLLAGAIPTPLYPPLRLGRLDEYHVRTASMLHAIDASLVITDSRVAKLLGETLTRAKPRRGWLDVAELGVATSRDAPLPTVTAKDIAFIQFSSGTTSSPKPVPLTHAQILANVEAIITAIVSAYPESPEAPHRAVSWLPLYHDMGLIGCVFGAMAYPGDITLLPPEAFVAEPARWLRTISEIRATVSAAPNFAYALCAERVRDDELDGVDLSCWRVAMNGAEPVAPRVLERFLTRFAPYGFRPEAMTPVYGLAEATLGVTFGSLTERSSMTVFDTQALAESGTARALADGEDRRGIRLVNLGEPLSCVEVRIADERGTALPAGQLGRILVRGASVTSGYFGEQRAGAWLDTGDTGFIHDSGLYLYGRAKDILIVRGRKYPPHDVEHAVTGLAGVRPGCVVAVGLESEGGEELVVFVEQGREGEIDEEELGRRVADATGLNVDRVVVLAAGTLPRTSSGKLSRSETRRRYITDTLHPPKRMNVVLLGIELVRSHIAMLRAREGE